MRSRAKPRKPSIHGHFSAVTAVDGWSRSRPERKGSQLLEIFQSQGWCGSNVWVNTVGPGPKAKKPLILLVGGAGFEAATPGL
jgi:hypothetical protein